MDKKEFPIGAFDPVAYFTTAKYFNGARGHINGNPITTRVAVEFPEKVIGLGNQICHRSLMWPTEAIPLSGSTGIYTALWNKCKDDYKANVLYWNFILDKKLSPWRALLKGRKIIRGKSGRPLAVYLKCDAQTSSQFFINLCIATRTAYEKANVTRAFAFALEEGLDLYEALLFSSSFKIRDNGDLAQVGWQPHFPFNFDMNIPLERLKNGPTVFHSDKLHNCADDWRSRPSINAIWCERGVSSKLIKIVRCHERYTGAFPTRFMDEFGSYNFDDGILPNPKDAIARIKEVRHTL